MIYILVYLLGGIAVGLLDAYLQRRIHPAVDVDAAVLVGVFWPVVLVGWLLVRAGDWRRRRRIRPGR